MYDFLKLLFQFCIKHSIMLNERREENIYNDIQYIIYTTCVNQFLAYFLCWNFGYGSQSHSNVDTEGHNICRHSTHFSIMEPFLTHCFCYV